jgi:threonine/homoserine/homoserine lactone efflux protein
MLTTAYLAYVLACTAIIIVPGPTVTIIIANSLRYGPRAGLLNVVGTQLGLLVWLTIAILGLSAIIHSLGFWYDLIRLAGAGYLVWLGFKLWRSRGAMLLGDAPPPRGGFVAQGFFVILSNPKVLIVFGALIPQFADPNMEFTRQVIWLGTTFMALATLLDGFYALLAGQLRTALSQTRLRWIELGSGTFLMAGGLWLALKVI